MVKTKNKTKKKRNLKREYVTLIFENPRMIKRTYGLFLGKRVKERRLVKIAEIVIHKQEKKIDATIYHNVKADVPIVLYTK